MSKEYSGENLTQARIKLLLSKMSQRQLAKKLGVSRSTIQRHLYGQSKTFSKKTIEKIDKFQPKKPRGVRTAYEIVANISFYFTEDESKTKIYHTMKSEIKPSFKEAKESLIDRFNAYKETYKNERKNIVLSNVKIKEYQTLET